MAMHSKLDAFLRAMKGVEYDFKPEWGYDRYRVGEKMFAAILRPGVEHNSLYAGKLLLTLKCDPLKSEMLRSQYSDVLPGFYADKRCWISVNLDGEMEETLIHSLCEDSYQLIFSKLTRKKQTEILAQQHPL